MALTTVNGIADVYVTKVTGTKTGFIRDVLLTEREQAFLAQAETDRGGTDMEDYLKTITYDHTNQNAWDHFAGFVEAFDSTKADLRANIDTDFAVADTATGMTQAELDDLIVRVNAIQSAITSEVL